MRSRDAIFRLVRETTFCMHESYSQRNESASLVPVLCPGNLSQVVRVLIL